MANGPYPIDSLSASHMMYPKLHAITYTILAPRLHALMDGDIARLDTDDEGRQPARQGDLTSYAYESIREAIISLTLQPGDPLRETSLANQFGVSRTPIRAALRRLESEGFVTLAPPRGFVVAQISIEDVENAYLVIELLEGLASRLAAERLTDEGETALRQLIAELKEASRLGDLDRWIEIDNALHRTIREIADNSILRQTSVVAFSTIERVRHMHMREQRDAGRLAEETAAHSSITKAILMRDGADAELQTRRLFASARVANLRLLNQWILPLRRSF